MSYSTFTIRSYDIKITLQRVFRMKNDNNKQSNFSKINKAKYEFKEEQNQNLKKIEMGTGV